MVVLCYLQAETEAEGPSRGLLSSVGIVPKLIDSARLFDSLKPLWYQKRKPDSISLTQCSIYPHIQYPYPPRCSQQSYALLHHHILFLI